ncbi:MAG: SpoIIE family protein phosphatase [Firmicutes bacterium]|nr:SpoIIE family protein phosphatase [Bacillota bacterium]
MRIAERKMKGAKRCACLIMCFLLVFIYMTGAVFADDGTDQPNSVDPVYQGDSCSAVVYDNTNGLPTSEANDIAQTSEGFIWIASYGGLIRYDGDTFERMESTTGVGSVVCLLADSKDRLWIGTNESGLAMMEHGEIQKWDSSTAFGADKVRTIIEGPDGTIYVGTTTGISLITPEMVFRHIDDPEIAGAYIEQLSLGGDGRLYGLTNEDDFFIVKDGKLEEYIDHNSTSIQGITGLLADPDNPGMLYIGTESTGIYYGDLRGSIDDMTYINVDPLFSIIGLQMLGDKVWIAANNGIGVLDSEGFHDLSSLPLNNSIGKVMEDYQGNLWFTSSRQGVMKIVLNRFQDFNERFYLPEYVVNSTCMFEDMLFVATDTGLLVLNDDGIVENVPVTEITASSGSVIEETDLNKLLEGVRIRSIIRDSKDRLWISTWRSNGLLRYDHGSLRIFNEDDGLISNHIRAVHETDDGAILVAHTGGLAVIRDDEVEATYTKEDGIENPEILTVSSTPEGDYLLGSNGGGIYVINKKGIKCISTEDGLTSGIIMRIKRDDENGVYWLVTSNSIAYMDKDQNITTIENFPYSNNFDMYKNNKGEMWVLSSDGIYVAPVDMLLANEEISTVHYGLANGLPSASTSNSYCELTDDGYLYISGNAGVSRINIDETVEEVKDIKLSVPFVDADKHRIYPDEDGKFTIPTSTLKLTIHAYIYNYSLSDPKVSYKLEGFDQENVELNRSELGPLLYTNLKGGDYNFVLEIKDERGDSSKGITVPITKNKAIYEEKWFFMVIGLALIMAVAFFVRMYIRWLISDLEQKHKEEEDRHRIMGELQLAGRIQTGMLPHTFPPFPDRKEFDIYATMDAAREIGGDFYDFYFLDDDHLCLVMADVSGKGIPAALFMMISKVLLKSFATMSESASDVLTKANETLCKENNVDMFVTVWLGILEISTGRLVAANAGHEYPVIKRGQRGFELFKDKHGLVVGGMSGINYKEYEIDLAPGDKIFLYTDGVPEATNAGKELFGTKRMVDALNKDPDASPKDILRNVRAAVDEFVKDEEQFDDITMLCLKYKGMEETDNSEI